MSYEEFAYEVEPIGLPKLVAEFIQEADSRYDYFYQKKLNKRYPRYVPSEPAQVYAALKFVQKNSLAQGTNFLEWGSGFGVGVGLAALLDFNATGIEIEPALVNLAESLVQKFHLPATFICESYIPDGFLSYDALGGDELLPDDSFGHSLEHPARYNGMDIDIEEIDLFFVYPWPGEQEMMLKLFDAVAGEGAILIAYYGDRDICLYRKIIPEDESDLNF